jgi:hypothetical protein
MTISDGLSPTFNIQREAGPERWCAVGDVTTVRDKQRKEKVRAVANDGDVHLQYNDEAFTKPEPGCIVA